MEKRSKLLTKLTQDLLPGGFPTEEEILKMTDEERETLFIQQKLLIQEFSRYVRNEMYQMGQDIDFYSDLLQTMQSIGISFTDLNNFTQKAKNFKKLKPKPIILPIIRYIATLIVTIIRKMNITPKKILIFVFILLSLFFYGCLYMESYNIQ